MHNQDTYTGASFSLSNRLKRVLWNGFYLFFFKFSPRPLHGYRAFILRLFGARVGKGVHVYPGVKIWAPWNLVLEDECGIASGVELYSQGVITVGKRAVISQGSYICTGTHDYTKKGFPLYTEPVFIESEAWLAAGVFVHPGVKINEGCVVGARSVVTKDMPDWMVCAGNPCKPLKERRIVK